MPDVKYKLTVVDLLTPGIKKATGAAEQLDSVMGNVGRTIAAAFATYELFAFGKSILDVTTKMESLNNVIKYTSIDSADAAKNHEFLTGIIDRLKLPIMETTEAYSSLSASMLGTKLQGQGARDVFEGVAIASTAMHLSAEQNQSVFLALSQMMSKGKIQAQELTLQLGQALPGAQRIAAAAMHMTTAEFMKQMEAGKILASDFLPKFSDELKKQFGGAIPNAIQSLQARQTEMNNKWIEMKLVLGEELKPLFIELISILTKLTTFFTTHIRLIKVLAVTLLGIGAGILLFKSFLMVAAAWRTALVFLQLTLSEGLIPTLYATGVAGQTMWAGLTGGLTLLLTGIYQLWTYLDNVEGKVGKFSAAMKKVWFDAQGAAMALTGNFAGAGAMFAQGDAVMRAWNIQNIMKGGPSVDELRHQQIQDIMNDKKKMAFIKSHPEQLTRWNDMLAKDKEFTAKGGLGAGKTPLDTPATNISGAKPTTINININKLVERLEIATTTITQGVQRSKEEITKALVEACTDAGVIAGQ